jgi:RNA polymerase sigma factor (sigma-70 family)
MTGNDIFYAFLPPSLTNDEKRPLSVPSVMLLFSKMQDLEQVARSVIERFSLLIRQVIQKNLYHDDDIDLEDIEQEVRLRIWIFLKNGKNVKNLPSYIKKVAYSTTIDELRKLMKQRPSGETENLRRIFIGSGLVSRYARDFSPEAKAEDCENKETIMKLINSLSENRKKVLQLYLEGKSIDDICTSLNWEKPRVRHLFYRGIDDLKEKGRFLLQGIPGNYPENWPPGEKS